MAHGLGFAVPPPAVSFSDSETLACAPPDPRTQAAGVVVTLARTPVDLLAADLLLESLYAARGYLVPRADAERESEAVLVAAENGETIGTLTLRFDGPDGLRADESYRAELDAARAEGRCVCELGRFAVARHARPSVVIGALFGEAHRLIRDRREITDVFVEVNPRHVAFYRSAFDFRVAGGERVCPRVHAPSMLLRLEVAAFDARSQPFDARRVWRNRLLSGTPMAG